MKQHIAIDKATPNVGALDFSHLLDAPRRQARPCGSAGRSLLL